MNKLLSIAVLTTALTFPASAGNTLTCKGLDKYLGANIGIFHNKPVLQCDLFTTWGDDGYYTDVWVSHGFSGSWQVDFSSEIDFTLGKLGSIGNFSYDVGVAYFSIADDGTGMSDVFQFYAELNKSFTSGTTTLTPFVKMEAYVASDFSDNPESGQFVRLGLKHSTVFSENWTLSGKAQVLRDSSSFGFPAGVFADADLTASYAITKNFSVGVTGKVAFVIDKKPWDPRGTETMFGFVTSLSF